ncbi:MAG: MBOAT family O-acyltransferase [bacterium]
MFYLVGERARWSVLLAASLLFYAALNVPYLLVVLILVTITTYGFGIWLDQASTPKVKRALIWGGVGANLLILIVMKYLPFLSVNIKTLSALLALDVQIQPVKLFVAIGVSYYVFQAISYLVDIYLEIEKPERHFGYFALYLAFFPKLLQGPIERAGDLIPQLKTRYEFNFDNMRFGMLLFTWGLFKKIVIADRLGLYVDAVYNDVHAFSGLSLLLATYAYAFQIYMDFSGYTDMALGSARLFNISLTQNFNSPYLATSVIDFWRRWHISFSSWILDYIFKPLQMQWRNWKIFGSAAALIVTFLISGIWHGASWGFVIWGGLHGLYMACSVYYKPYQEKLHKTFGIEKTRLLSVFQILVTFNLVSLAWVFFRANNISDAFYIFGNIIYLQNSTAILKSNGHSNIFFILIAIVFYISSASFINSDTKLFQSRFRWIFYYMLFFVIFYIGMNNESFIYFQF